MSSQFHTAWLHALARPLACAAVAVAAVAGLSAAGMGAAYAADDTTGSVQSQTTTGGTASTPNTAKGGNTASNGGASADAAKGDGANSAANTDGSSSEGTANGGSSAGANAADINGKSNVSESVRANADTTTPSVTTDIYAADKDGKVAADATPITTGVTNAKKIRVAATVVYPADKFAALQTDDTKTLTLTLSVTPDPTQPAQRIEKTVKYADFVQAVDEDGKPIENTYTLVYTSADETTTPVTAPEFDLIADNATYTLSITANDILDANGNAIVVNDVDLAQDAAAPKAAGVAYASAQDAADAPVKAGDTWLTKTKRVFTFTTDAADTDIDHLEISGKYSTDGKDSKALDAVKITAANGAYSWTTPEDGVYKLADLNVVVIDKAGNRSDATKLDAVKTDNTDPAATAPATLVVDAAAGRNTAITVNGTEAKDLKGTYTKVIGVTVKNTDDKLFVKRLEIAKAAKADATLLTGLADNCVIPTTPDTVITCNGAVTDGTYTVGLNTAVLPNATAKVTFNVDGTAPVVTDIRYVSNNQGRDYTRGKTTVAMGDKAARSIIFTVEDAAPNGANYASGVKSVVANGTYTDPFGANKTLANVELKPVAGQNGQYELVFDQSGVYDFSKIEITVSDKAGNGSAAESITDIANGLTPAADVPGTLKLLNGTSLGKVSSTIRVNGKDYGNGPDVKYLRQTATVTILVKNNPFFEDVWNTAKNDTTAVNLLNRTLAADGTDDATGVCPVDGAAAYVQQGAGEYLITACGKPGAGQTALIPDDNAGAGAAPGAVVQKNGTYTITPADNATAQFLLGKTDNNPTKFGIDNQKPSITGVTYHADAKTDLKATVDGEARTLANGPRSFDINVRDLLRHTDDAASTGGDQKDTSGVADVTAKIDYTTFAGKKQTKNVTLTAKKGEPGVYTLTLGTNDGKEDGVYTLAGVTLTVKDKAITVSQGKETDPDPNVLANTTLADAKTNLKLAALPDSIGISGDKGGAKIGLDGVSGNSPYNKDIKAVTVAVTDKAFKYRWDILKNGYQNVDVFATSTLEYASKTDNVTGLTIGKASETETKEGGVLSWDGALLPQLDKKTDLGGSQKNGGYTLKFTNTVDDKTLLAKPADFKYTLDTMTPQVTDIKRESTDPNTNLVTGYQGHNIRVASGSQTLSIRVRDLLPEEQRKNTGVDEKKGNDAYTAQLDSVRISVPEAKDLAGKSLGAAEFKQSPDTPNNDGDGWYNVTISSEGFYPLNDVTVTATDNAKNTASNVKFGDLAKKHGLAYDAIVVDNGTTPNRGASIAYGDVSGNPQSREPGYYFRGDVNQTVTVTDRWFPLYQRLSGLQGEQGEQGDFYAGQVDKTPQRASGKDIVAVADVNPTQLGKTGEYTYQYTNKIRPAGASNRAEGHYNTRVNYIGLLPANNAKHEKAQQSKDFVMDWTAPKLGNLTFSATSPKHWNWIFATNPLRVTLDGVNDPISGICSVRATNSPNSHDCTSNASAGKNGVESVGFRAYDRTNFRKYGTALNYDPWISNTNANPTPAAVYSGSTAGGVISFLMTGDSQRLTLNGTAIGLTDAAGNPVDTGSLNDYARSNVRGVTGVAIDTVAPRLTVTYDNNSARHGKYYKAHRTATVTISESNFDFIRKFDGGRVVVTSSVDGRKSTVPVSAFTNANGDRRTYTTQIRYAQDGDWVVDAAITDPGDHRSNTYHAEFPSATVNPVLKLAFDNNNARNGIYYNATRTATITEVERNFTAAESPITTTAKDDNGSAASAPGPGQWTKSGGQYTWTNSVAFTGEFHYTLKAEATDLAGNQAVVVTEPEFVIDLTKPKIDITRVEDKTAYAGTVAPKIAYDDTNIDFSKVTYTLSGAHRGTIKNPEASETSNKNDRTVDFADFQRKVDVDDVYTLTAHATDMAGNEFEAKKTFSANRFGSTYLFDTETKSLRGAYLKQAEPVRVTEINVSGLQTGKSAITVVKDSKATQLGKGDFNTESENDKGWSRTLYSIPVKQFGSDGYYRVLMQSVDKAGNLSQNTMNKKDADRKGTAEVQFAIDGTAPTASMVGAQSGGVYYGSEKAIAVNAKDNLDLASAELYVDGDLKGKWDDDQLLKQDTSYSIPSDAARHEVSIRAYDKAGNMTTANYDNVMVAANWWQYATHTGWILNTMIFGAILVLAAIAAGIVFAARRKRGGDYRANPFDR
ncbi:hypothetical protein [Bifidobacterium catulorum]|uniref:Cell surface protein n=1 Tax=Bifidobacterium catulorum TaxID=1630173 RepID=A0A2U2MR09_9BIFI|nr:hypothetical protein [Bifidobacterium catulorum]PWG59273.1 hypothetical protein DF200_08540 [Bifidobacterium catulorum]